MELVWQPAEIPGTRMQGAVFDPVRRANEPWNMERKRKGLDS